MNSKSITYHNLLLEGLYKKYLTSVKSGELKKNRCLFLGARGEQKQTIKATQWLFRCLHLFSQEMYFMVWIV